MQCLDGRSDQPVRNPSCSGAAFQRLHSLGKTLQGCREQVCAGVECSPKPEVSVEYLVVRMPAFAVQEMAGSGLYGGGRQRTLQVRQVYGPAPAPEAGWQLPLELGKAQQASSSFTTRMRPPRMPVSLIRVSPGPWEGELSSHRKVCESSLIHRATCLSVLALPSYRFIQEEREGSRFTS